MSEYSRSNILAGEEIRLRVVFSDSAGNLIDPDAYGSSPPQLYIYSADTDSETIATEIEALTFDSAEEGPLSSTRLAQGYYEYVYQVPEGATTGTWVDVWVATVNSTVITSELSFIVTEEILADVQTISTNTLLVLELIDILSEDGDVLNDTIYYLTKLSPFYASPEMVKMEVGPWMSYIPDDTIALMILWSSKEADFIQRAAASTSDRLKFSRSKYVIYDCAYRILNQFGASPGASSAGGKKQLGDLSIQLGSGTLVVDREIVNDIRKQRSLWLEVLNSGGFLVPGAGYGPQIGIKGLLDPDRSMLGRNNAEVNSINFPVPTINKKVLEYPYRKGRWKFVERT